MATGKPQTGLLNVGTCNVCNPCNLSTPVPCLFPTPRPSEYLERPRWVQTEMGLYPCCGAGRASWVRDLLLPDERPLGGGRPVLSKLEQMESASVNSTGTTRSSGKSMSRTGNDPLRAVAPRLINAVVSMEDNKFTSTAAGDRSGSSAALKNFTAGHVRQARAPLPSSSPATVFASRKKPSGVLSKFARNESRNGSGTEDHGAYLNRIISAADSTGRRIARLAENRRKT